ncbi:putative glycoside hydrolase, family 2, immunoglobulin-like beta-sandwich [Septoria linicola]|nr:putative glycoside hydrolase, family 2, immunoglobulin-like beta-sandwich [Septoria linicola]
MHFSLAIYATPLAGVVAAHQPLHFARQSPNATQPYQLQTPPLDTEWTAQVGLNPWPQHPRPKLKRDQWQNLNGIWQYSNASGLDALNDPPFGQDLAREVLVPFCLESGLSGIQGEDVLYSWYRTTFTVPSNWTGDRVLLNFDSVDYEATVYVNGQNVTFHRGGYFAFSVDVTDALRADSENELIVFVHDPTDSGDFVIPIGKQTLRPSHIFYRPCSGIWQTVWLESVPLTYIESLDINGDSNGNLNITAIASDDATSDVQVTVYEKNTTNTVATGSGSAGSPFSFKVDAVQLWTPESPILYDIVVKVADDEIQSYTGFRTISRGDINGVQRILLNGASYFPFGTLDQGYWPDGLHTPPTYEAMVYDLEVLKNIGYNMLRKHIKVESPLFYEATDRMGLLVMQDMPALRPSQSRTLEDCTTVTILPDAAQQQEFQRQLELLVTQFRSYTSIFSWVVYNEGWGQLTTQPYPEFGLTDIVRQLDPTRLVNANSGWYDHGAGDFSDNHHYANPQCGTPFYSINSSPHDPSRIGFQGEFGGTGHNVSAQNLWKVEQAINEINRTYEIDETLDIWNYRGHFLLTELLSQVELYSCAGGVWTQTTDVEGEVNGMLTYDRRIIRPQLEQWNADIKALYDASAARSNVTAPVFSATAVCTSAATPWNPSYYDQYVWMPAGPARTTGGGGVPGGW